MQFKLKSRKSRLSITYFAVAQSFWNFAQSKVMTPPCSVQNVKTIEQLFETGVMAERDFARFEFKMGSDEYPVLHSPHTLNSQIYFAHIEKLCSFYCEYFLGGNRPRYNGNSLFTFKKNASQLAIHFVETNRNCRWHGTHLYVSEPRIHQGWCDYIDEWCSLVAGCPRPLWKGRPCSCRCSRRERAWWAKPMEITAT